MNYQPTEPPERRTISCPECEGVEDAECLKCYGDGIIDFDPGDDPYAPDTWKEAEGIA
jgi:hypothetical protein